MKIHSNPIYANPIKNIPNRGDDLVREKFSAQTFYKISSGELFDVMWLHDLHQSILRSLFCNIKNSMVKWSSSQAEASSRTPPEELPP